MKRIDGGKGVIGTIAVFGFFIGLWISPIRATVVERFESIFGHNQTAESPAEFPPAPRNPYFNLDPFHFLEPLAPNAGDSTKFDSSLLNYLTVEVCVVTAGDCQMVKTFTSQGQTAERLRIGRTGNIDTHYIVNWDTLEYRIPNQNTYRISVTLANLVLGSIDIPPDRQPYLRRTWPIKFLIENDPTIRVRLLRYLGRSASQVANVLRTEFGLCGEETAALLSGDLEPFSPAEIEVAISGVCQEVMIPHTTKVADETTRNALSTFDPATGQMTFLAVTPLLRSLSIGDVLASEPGSAAPYGYLRKIISIRSGRGRVVLETVQAKLNEAISQGTLDASGVLRPGSLSRATTPERSNIGSGKQLSSVNGLDSVDEGDGFTFQRDIDVTFNLETGGDGTGGTGTVRVQGSVYFNAAYNVGIGIETCAEVPPVCVDRFEAWTGLEQKSKLRVTGVFDGHLNKEQKIFDVPLDPIVFFIGPVPVVIVPKVEILVGVNGEAHVDFSFEAKASSRFKAGAKWTDPNDGGRGWENLTDFTPLEDEFIDADFNGNMRVEGYAKLDASLLLYNVAGPGMDGSVGIGGDVQTGRRPYWKVFGHVKTNVDFEVDIGGIIDLGGWSAPILNEYFEIADSPNQVPTCTYRTDVISANVNTPVFLGPRLGGLQGFFDCTDPESETITYSAMSSVDGPIPPSMTANFQSGGPRTVTVTATDASGGQANFNLAFNVFNSAPLVTIYGNSQVAATVQYFATATAHDLETGQFLTCDRLNWQVAAPDTLTLTGSGGTCGAVIRFNQQGTRTVTVNATDIHGAVGTSSISVNVTAPPVNRPPEINFFAVYAYRGPFQFPCEDPNYLCLIPNNAVLNNGFPGSGVYYPPLYMDVSATDPDGTTPSVTWTCTTGTNSAPVTWSNEYGYPTCDPIPSNEFPIIVKVVVSDGVTSVERQHTYRMFVGPN